MKHFVTFIQDAVTSTKHRRKETSPFNWRRGELRHLISSQTTNDRLIIIASDVIYDEDLTEAFFRALEILMSSPQRLEQDTASSEGNNSNNWPTNNFPAANTRRNAGDQGGTPTKIPTPKLTFHEMGDTGADTSTEGSPVLYLALEKRFNFTIKDMSVVATGYSALQRNVLDTTDGPITTPPCGQGHASSFKFEGVRLPLSFQQCFRYARDDNMEIWRIKPRMLS